MSLLASTAPLPPRHSLRSSGPCYGKLNAAGDNAIFVAHFYSGTSHAAGKYAPADAAPGYWDPIIGSGRPIDTNKYFVITPTRSRT